MLKAPFVYFGGKSAIAHEVWAALGQPAHYLEPFFGSGAVLLARPNYDAMKHTETVCDADGHLANVWRALQAEPDAVAKVCDWPVNHCVPAGTLIATPHGDIPVESVRRGMTVYGFDGQNIVPTIVNDTTSSETTKPLMQVGPLAATGNHPIWTAQGYIEAENLNWPVDQADLFLLEYDHEIEDLDSLCAFRSAHRRDSIRWSNLLQARSTIRRPSIQSKNRRTNTPRRLDTIIACVGNTTNLPNSGNRGPRLARCRTPLDCSLQGASNESYGRRRRNAGTRDSDGGTAKTFTPNDGQEISAGATICHAWQETYTGSGGENTGVKYGAQAYARNDSETGCTENGTYPFRRKQAAYVHCTQRKNSYTATPTKNFRYDDESEASHLLGNRTNFHVGNSGSKSLEGQRSEHQPICPQEMPLQGQSLQVPLTVYNFQTTTGNYFANRVLVHNCDLMARKIRLNEQTANLLERLSADEKYFNAELAGYWIWAASCWIGNGLICPGQRPHLSTGGQGIHAKGKIPHLGDAGHGVQEPYNTNLYAWFRQLSERLRNVRVVCGDWKGICGGDWQTHMGNCGLFFDPPYGTTANRDSRLYSTDSLLVADEVREWCLTRGGRKDHRIALAGYYDEHESLLRQGWRVHRWSAQGGYANLAKEKADEENRHNEALFFNPHCLDDSLFAEAARETTA